MKLKIDFPIQARPLGDKWPSFFMLGSCFAENQARNLDKLGFNVYANPFGIIYNPVSIEKILQRIVEKKNYRKEDFEVRDQAFSWDHHGDYKYTNPAQAAKASNTILGKTKKQLKDCDTIVITLGTSLVYTHNHTIVANCHKLPNKEFAQEQLYVNRIKESLCKSIAFLVAINPDAHIIFTVSPIRHLRSGIVESSRSKATLLTALHEILDELNSHNLSYFPSYEIFMDELRDYRFAKEDMTHPSTLAENYILERFLATYFSTETQSIVEEVKKYKAFAEHRPKDAKKHATQTAALKQKLTNKYPFIQLK